MAVQVEQFHSSPIARAISPTDRSYSSLEEEEEDSYTDVDIHSLSVERWDDHYSNNDEDTEVYKADTTIPPKQMVSFISEIKLAFDYPQSKTTPTVQTKPQVTAVLTRAMGPIPSVEISFKSEFEMYCFEDTTLQNVRRKELLQNPGEKSHSPKFSRVIKIRQNMKRRAKSNLVCHVSLDNLGRKQDKPYIDLWYLRDSPNSGRNPVSIRSLCDTGASRSVLPLSVARHLNLHINTSVPIYIRTAADNRVRCTGTTWLNCKHPSSGKWTQIPFIVVKTAKVLIISNHDLKRLRMLEPKFPYFIGDIPENIPMSDDQKSDEESVRSVYTTEEGTGYVTPETHIQISQVHQIHRVILKMGPE